MKTLLKTILLTTLIMMGLTTNQKSTDKLNDVEIQLIDINTKLNEKTGFTRVEVFSKITNYSDKEMSSIKYEILLYDKDNVLIKSFYKTYYGENISIKQNQSIEDYYGFQSELDRKVDRCELKIIETKDIEQLPLIHLPLPDEYLYQAVNLKNINNIDNVLPNKIHIHIDRMGAANIADIVDEETIKKFVELFCKVKIDYETDQFVTDNYNSITFEFNEEVERISLNLYNLEIHSHKGEHLYVLKDHEEFVRLCLYLAKVH